MNAPLGVADGMRGRALRATAKFLPEHARAHNRSLVLQMLFQGGQLTRADVARATRLTRVTVSDLVAELLEEGLIEELGIRPGTHVGKPATLLGLKNDAMHIVAIDISDEHLMRGAVLNLRGDILERQSVEIAGRGGEAAVDMIEAMSRDLMAATTQPILGVGVGSPGILTLTGTVIQAPNFDWYDVPLAQILSDRLQTPVHVANDANAAALGEHTYGGASSADLMVLQVGKGVGAGIVIDGVMLTGHHFAAGEIGHVTVADGPDDGELCACGRRGCLETVLGVPALRALIAGKSQEASDAALASVGQRLGAALALVVSALNLREILISGPADLLDGALKEAALRTIRERTISSVSDDLEIRMASLGEDVVLAGAAVLVLSGQLGVS